MLKRSALFLCLWLGSALHCAEANNLPFYKETEHFQAYCLEKDIEATDNVLQDLEKFYQKCVHDFRYLPTISEKLRLNIYPDISTFHLTLNEETLSQWKVAKYSHQDNVISLVTPKNPGTVHTEDTVFKCAQHALGYFFIYTKYPQASSWLSCGLTIYESRVYTKDVLKKHLVNNGQVVLPSCAQIDEQITHENFTSRSYPIAAFSYAEFLVTNWSWEKALALLENPAAFETILGVSQEEFQKMCIQYLQKELL